MLQYREPSFEAVRDIVTTKTAVKFRFSGNKKGVIIDLFTASAICAVYDALTENNLKEKMERMLKTENGFIKIANFCISKIK